MAKKEELHSPATIQNEAKIVRAGLNWLGFGLPGQRSEQFAGCKSISRKKIEINRRSMAQPQRQRRPTVQNKVLRDRGTELSPDAALGGRQFVQFRMQAVHGMTRFGSGGISSM